MAIDTRNKRSSAIQPMLPWRGYFPAPDSTVDQSDRQHTALLYSGIAADAPAAATGLIYTNPLDGLGSLMRGGPE